MGWLVWAGTALTLAGLAGLLWCIRIAAAARRPGQDPAQARAALGRAVAINMASLGTAALGLGAVAAGLLLG